MNKTNNVLLIVEGKSDEEALFAISEYNRHHNASSNEKPEIIIIPTNRDMLTALTDEEDGREPILKEDCMKLILKTIRNQLEAKCAEAKIKVSQISKAHVDKPSDVLSIGQEITAKIVDLNEAEKKISLSMKALENENQAEEDSEE